MIPNPIGCASSSWTTSEFIADTLAFILEASGHRARKACGGTAATVIATAFRPHAVISDVMMPGMDGFELAEWLEEHQPACWVSGLRSHWHHRVPTAER